MESTEKVNPEGDRISILIHLYLYTVKTNSYAN